MLATVERPRRCKSKFQRAEHAGPNAWRDAGDAQRSRWIRQLAAIVICTPNSREEYFHDSQLTFSSSEWGCVHAARTSANLDEVSCVAGDSAPHSPTTAHDTECLPVPLSEPPNRGVLKNAHPAFDSSPSMMSPAHQKENDTKKENDSIEKAQSWAKLAGTLTRSKLFTPKVAHVRTVDSGMAQMPSSTATLGFAKLERFL